MYLSLYFFLKNGFMHRYLATNSKASSWKSLMPGTYTKYVKDVAWSSNPLYWAIFMCILYMWIVNYQSSWVGPAPVWIKVVACDLIKAHGKIQISWRLYFITTASSPSESYIYLWSGYIIRDWKSKHLLRIGWCWLCVT